MLVNHPSCDAAFRQNSLTTCVVVVVDVVVVVVAAAAAAAADASDVADVLKCFFLYASPVSGDRRQETGVDGSRCHQRQTS